jgi:ribosome biogenesis GTPase / thiamine phosphate phosphatase
VGKSTLINQLCTEDVQFVQPVRESDHKGRHTTTEREIISLPNGGLIIDTPGLRELQLWEGAAGVREGFADIESLARACRFTDCRHENEPGCAVLGAVQRGEIEMARLESHRKLVREAEYFERRQDVRKQAEAQRRTKTLTKALRFRLKEKGRDED